MRKSNKLASVLSLVFWCGRSACVCLLILMAMPTLVRSADDPALRGLLLEAEQSFAQDRNAQALDQVNQYIQLAPPDAKAYFLRAAIHDAMRHYERSLPDYNKAIQLDPTRDLAYQRRGVANFMLGNMKESIVDFDKYLETHPDEKPQHWQRGIALYYAGRFEDGAKQFELHRTVNPEDVENAAWHFLCVARWKNVDTARAGLIPIKEDSRVPMMKIHDMFAGKATPDDVIKEAQKDNPPEARLNRQLFYAHLYVALYCEATGNNKEAQSHLTAAAQHQVPDYMYGVAKVHLKLLEKGK